MHFFDADLQETPALGTSALPERDRMTEREYRCLDISASTSLSMRYLVGSLVIEPADLRNNNDPRSGGDADEPAHSRDIAVLDASPGRWQEKRDEEKSLRAL